MLAEFRTFIARGNVMDMAVGIILGAAFTAIVNSMVADLINPVIGVLTGNIDFSEKAILLTAGPEGAAIRYGAFINAVIKFLIVAWAVFLLVKAVNRLKEAAARGEVPEADPAPEVPKAPSEAELLAEIRDLLRERPAG